MQVFTRRHSSRQRPKITSHTKKNGHHARSDATICNAAGGFISSDTRKRSQKHRRLICPKSTTLGSMSPVTARRVSPAEYAAQSATVAHPRGHRGTNSFSPPTYWRFMNFSNSLLRPKNPEGPGLSACSRCSQIVRTIKNILTKFAFVFCHHKARKRCSTW